MPIVCRRPDESRLRDMGFSDVLAVDGAARWLGLDVARTGGRLSRDALRERPRGEGLEDRVAVPADGDDVSLA